MTEKSKILVVDDEEFNLDILTDCLTEVGYDIISATDGLIALKKLEEHPDVSVIILDRMMPHMDGTEALDAIKKDARFKNIPVIMQTAAASNEQLNKWLDRGVYSNLIKPFDIATLLNIVDSASKEISDQIKIKA